MRHHLRSTSVVDEVVADMGVPIGARSAGHCLASAFNGPQRDPYLRVAVWRREFLNGLALTISAEKVHPSVRAGGIALQHLFDETHRLDVLAPIDRRAEAQAGNGIGERDLVRRLPLMFAANRGFGSRLARREVLFDRHADRRQAKTVFANAVQELYDRADLEG